MTTVAVLAGYSVVMVNLGFASQVALAITLVVCETAGARITNVVSPSDRHEG
jgi:hypothetical protein